MDAAAPWLSWSPSAPSAAASRPKPLSVTFMCCGRARAANDPDALCATKSSVRPSTRKLSPRPREKGGEALLA